MNAKLTEIAYILDRSGSMQPMVEPAIAGFNRFLAEQRDAPGRARLTLVLFDDQYEVPCRSLPIEEVTELDITTYVPRNTTALLDAIGRTIDELGRQLAATPEPERPGQVVVAIFTDGLENASREYDMRRISEMIRHQREAYNWQFLFLGAYQDAIATAATMGIDRRYAVRVGFSKGGVSSVSHSLSRKLRAMRHHATTGEQLADFTALMQQIAKEEEQIAEQTEEHKEEP